MLSLVSSSSWLSLLRKCHCAGSNFVGFILYCSTDPSNVGEFFRSWILKDFIQLRKRKRKSFICVDILHNREISHFHVVRSRATTAKKCTKKVWCTCKVVVLLIYSYSFFAVLVAVAVIVAQAPWWCEMPAAFSPHPQRGPGAWPRVWGKGLGQRDRWRFKLWVRFSEHGFDRTSLQIQWYPQNNELRYK